MRSSTSLSPLFGPSQVNTFVIFFLIGGDIYVVNRKFICGENINVNIDI